MSIGDGLVNPSGFELSNAEFAFLKADDVYVLASSQTADVRVGDLTIDALKTPFVGIGAGGLGVGYTTAPQTISIEGVHNGY